MRQRAALIVPVAGLALLLTACSGGASKSAEGATAGSLPASATAAGTVQIEMVDIAFAPKTLDVKKGATVKFVFTNTGQIVHDAVVGDSEVQDKHEKEMRATPAGGHDGDGGAAVVKPGETGEITHTFDKAGTFEIGCHQAGHYGAGMKIKVTVT